MNPLSKEQRSRLEDVAIQRFYNRIELCDLFLWLDNFAPEEYDMAIEVLEHVDFYRENDFVSLLANAMNNLPINIKTTHLHFIPIGNPGKSGSIVLYQLHKLSESLKWNATFYNTADKIEIDLGQENYSVLVDDFIGSGSTIDKFFKENHNNIKFLEFSKLCIVAGIAMRNSIERLRKKYKIHIAVGDIKDKAFEKGISPFGGYVRMKRVRDFCYKYGKKLCCNMPLGYKNAQSLVIIEHTSPNNSLPILWYDYEGSVSWKPLAPRSYIKVVEKAYSERQDNNRWISVFRKNIGIEDEKDIKNMFSGDNYILIMVLRLLMEKKTESVIANILGLTYEDMQHIKIMGVSREYWNEKWEVNDYAKRQYSETIAHFMRQNRERKEMFAEREDNRNMIYVPKTFRNLE